MARVGLEVGERVPAAIGREAVADAELFEQLHRMLLDLVGAHRQEEARLFQPVQGRGHARIKLGPHADILAVMDHELPEQLVEIGGRQLLSGGFEAALDQGAGPCADHVARLGHRQGSEALPVEDHVEGPDEVAGRVCQGSIEVEDRDGGGEVRGINGHEGRLPAGGKGIKPWDDMVPMVDSFLPDGVDECGPLVPQRCFWQSWRWGGSPAPPWRPLMNSSPRLRRT